MMLSSPHKIKKTELSLSCVIHHGTHWEPYSGKPVTLVSTPLRGVKHKKSRVCFENRISEWPLRHLYPSMGYWTEYPLSSRLPGIAICIMWLDHLNSSGFMLNFLRRYWRVERGMSRRLAAPFFPPTIPFVAFNTWIICVLSACCRVWKFTDESMVETLVGNIRPPWILDVRFYLAHEKTIQ